MADLPSNAAANAFQGPECTLPALMGKWPRHKDKTNPFHYKITLKFSKIISLSSAPKELLQNNINERMKIMRGFVELAHKP